jgi:hypothetical protein
VALTALTGFSQAVSKKGYRVSAVKGKLTVTYRGKAHSMKPAEEYIDAARITGTKILFVSKVRDFTYLLIDVTGQSKSRRDARECGAGTESNLIRVKLDGKWQVTTMDGIRYESCWSNIDAGDGYTIKNNVLSVEFDNFHDDENVKLEYDANDPEGAFKIAKKKIEN